MTALQPNQRFPHAADTWVLIPAAGRVPEGLLGLSNISSPAMIPVGGRPVIYWTMRYLQSLGFRRFRIAVSRPGMFVEEFVRATLAEGAEVEFVVPPRDGGLGQTVLSLAEWRDTDQPNQAIKERHNAQGAPALVVLGDTHFTFDAQTSLGLAPLVLASPVSESYRWCLEQHDGDNTLVSLIDKDPNAKPPFSALIGVYYFPDRQKLAVAAADEVALSQKEGRRAEMRGILERIQLNSKVTVARAETWLDCGNPDSQARSHQVLLQARAFNQLAIDETRGTLTKRSEHKEKLIDEINYLRLLPNDLAILFPRTVAFETGFEKPSITMEYYGYPSLSEVFVFHQLDAAIWRRVFTHLRSVLDLFAQHQRPLSDVDVRDMYLTKTRTRLSKLENSPLADLVRGDAIKVNGRNIRPVDQLLEGVELWLNQRIGAGVPATIIHGDFCLPNILYSLTSNIAKLIDPRGSFGRSGIYGDPLYDVAKLYHSVVGHYDLIVSDLFRASKNGTQLSLEIASKPQHKLIEKAFTEVFFPGGLGARDAQMVAGLLFISMPALHYDAPTRQLAMLARGYDLLESALS